MSRSQVVTNAPQTNLTFTRSTHKPPERRTMPINRRHRPASQPHSLSHPHARARWPVEPSPARAPPTSPPAPPPAGPSRPAASEKGYDHEVDGEEAGLELRREPRGIFARALPPAALVAAPGQGKAGSPPSWTLLCAHRSRRHSRAALIGHRATGCPSRRRRGEDEEKTAHGQPVARWPINAARERCAHPRTVHRSVPPALR